MSNSVSRWVDNVYKAASKSAEASGIYTAENAMNPSAKAKSKEAKEARGQLWGAILQNRTYVDRKTGKAKGD